MDFYRTKLFVLFRSIIKPSHLRHWPMEHNFHLISCIQYSSSDNEYQNGLFWFWRHDQNRTKCHFIGEPVLRFARQFRLFWFSIFFFEPWNMYGDNTNSLTDELAICDSTGTGTATNQLYVEDGEVRNSYDHSFQCQQIEDRT